MINNILVWCWTKDPDKKIINLGNYDGQAEGDWVRIIGFDSDTLVLFHFGVKVWKGGLLQEVDLLSRQKYGIDEYYDGCMARFYSKRDIHLHGTVCYSCEQWFSYLNAPFWIIRCWNCQLEDKQC